MAFFKSRKKSYEQDSLHRPGEVWPVKSTLMLRPEEALSPGASFNFPMSPRVEFHGVPYSFLVELRHLQPNTSEGAVRDLKKLVHLLESGGRGLIPVRRLVADAVTETFRKSLANRGEASLGHGLVAVDRKGSKVPLVDPADHHLGRTVTFLFPVAVFDGDGLARMVRTPRVGTLKRLTAERLWLKTDTGLRVFRRSKIESFQVLNHARSGVMAYYRFTLTPSTYTAEAYGRWDYLGTEHPRTVLPIPERSREGVAALLRRLQAKGEVEPLRVRVIPKEVVPKKPKPVAPKLPPVPKPDPWRPASWEDLLALRGKSGTVRDGSSRDSQVHWMRFVTVERDDGSTVLLRGRNGTQLRGELGSLHVPLEPGASKAL